MLDWIKKIVNIKREKVKEHLPEWKTDFETLLPKEVDNMQKLFLYLHKLHRNKESIGRIVNGKPEYVTRDYVHKKALSVGSYLLSLGLNKGDVLRVYSESRFEIALFIEVCHLFGFICVMCFDNGKSSYPEYVIKDAAPKVVYVSQLKYINNSNVINQDVDGLLYVISEEKLEKLNANYKNLIIDELYDYDPIDVSELPPVLPNEPCTICYSSGTVGNPKGVVINHEAMLRGLMYIVASVPCTECDVHVSFLPAAHILERIAILLFIFRGARICFSSSEVNNIMKYYKCAGFTGGSIIPSILIGSCNNIRKMLDSELKKKLYYFNVKLTKICRFFGFRCVLSDLLIFNKIREVAYCSTSWLGCAGDVFAKDIHDELTSVFDIRIQTIFGMSEVAGPVSVAPRGGIVPGTVGRLLPYLEMKFEEKEIIIKSPALFNGYWKKDNVYKEVVKDGWYYSGDDGYPDPKTGFLVVRGRCSEIISGSELDLVLPYVRHVYQNWFSDIAVDFDIQNPGIIAIGYMNKLILNHLIEYINRYYERNYAKFNEGDDFKTEEDSFIKLVEDEEFVNYIRRFLVEHVFIKYDERIHIRALKLLPKSFRDYDLITETGKLKFTKFREHFRSDLDELKKRIPKVT